MNELTCKECKHYRTVGWQQKPFCHITLDDITDDTPLCADFESKSGKRPRFCRLASSVDEMAEELVICMNGGWLVTPTGDTYRKTELKEAIAAAKKWLMEVE